ncbi:MAG: hypothetical protein IKN41_04980 [Candidatus Methanomethylophilaceae archaeon]|nr:hypothetical protein [Candidatus Methanomethylophilaceae archaeon]
MMIIVRWFRDVFDKTRGKVQVVEPPIGIIGMFEAEDVVREDMKLMFTSKVVLEDKSVHTDKVILQYDLLEMLDKIPEVEE